jgi:site-specific recombinase XerC
VERASEDSCVIPATSRWATSNADLRWLAPTWTALQSGSSTPPSRQPRRPCRETAATCLAVQALREHREVQAADRLKAGALWQDHGLVFASSVGTPLDRHNVLREFRKITETAGLGTDWVPRELRHTFVSLLSSDRMPIEDIADLVGHKGTVTTKMVYRKVIVPELRRSAEVMDRLFSRSDSSGLV